MSTSISASTLDKFKTFGDLLRFLRRRAGITQMELSIAVGYSDAQISRLEQNLRLPDLPTIEARFVSALSLADEPEVVSRLLDLAANVRREDAPLIGLCPYKGLSYFDEADADLFAGRELLTARLFDRVLSITSAGRAGGEKFLAIIGASGSGKSSLVRAGLVPALRWNPATANWPIHVITPTAHPLESLAMSLTHDNSSVSAAASLMDDLARDARSLGIFSKRMLQAAGSDYLLIIIDQFEEVFTLCRSEEERCAYIGNLLTAACEAGGSVIAVITLRADFYAHCAGYDQLRHALAHQQEYIGTMSSGELRHAIEEPARRGRWEFEPGLVDLLLHDVGSEPGALPLLSHALLETWQRRRGRVMTLSGYTSSGGVRSAIAETAEAVFADQFSEQQKIIARRVFLRLTELGDETATGDTRRRAAYSELILKPEEAPATQAVIQALADARLIITHAESAEVAHEALIREWPKLRGWLEDNREGLRLHRHLAEAAKDWDGLSRESDGLYRGARLSQAREWAATHMDEMNRLEREFLEASQVQAECEATQREMQRQRELETAQKLAEAEKQRAEVESRRAEEHADTARQLRKRALYLAGAFVVALGMVFVALFFGAQARQAATAAQNQQRIALSRELAAAATSNLQADPERSILLALQAIETTYSIDKTWTAEAEEALRRALQASRVQLTLRGHSARVWAVAFSPGCEREAAKSTQPCRARLATASEDGTAKIWDASTGKELLTLSTGATRGRFGIAFSPDGLILATPGEVGTALLWDVVSGQELLQLRGHTDWVTSVAYSPEGERLVTGSEDRTARVWDAATGDELLTLAGHIAQIRDVDFSPDGERIATASDDGKVIIWDSSTGDELLKFSAQNTHPVNGVAFSPDGEQLATTGGDRTVKVWDAATGEEQFTLRGHTDIIWKVAFSPDGTRLASTSFDGKVKVWDALTGQELFTLTGHTSLATGLAFSPDCVSAPDALAGECGLRLATASMDGTVKVWNASLSKELLTLYTPGAASGAINQSGTSLATGFEDGTVKVISTSTDLQEELAGKNSSAEKSKPPIILRGHEKLVNGVAFSPDGARLATMGEDRTAIVWNLETGEQIFTLLGHTGGLSPIIFNSDGTRLATASVDYRVKIWDITKNTDQALLILSVPEWSYALAFSPDGSRLATGNNNGVAKVWDAATGEELMILRGHTGEIWGIAYSPDGKFLVTGSEDRMAKVWDAKTGQEILTLTAHTGAVNGVAYSPDGNWVATASQDGTVKVWNAITGQEQQTLSGHTDAVAGVTFSHEGAWLISASIDGVVRYHLLEIEDLMALARSRLTRTITSAECQQFLHLPQTQCPQETAAILPPAGLPPAYLPVATNSSPEAARSLLAKGKVCVLTDEGGVNDQFFNQLAYQGIQVASVESGWETDVLESQHKSEYAKNINLLLQSDCDLLVMPTSFLFSSEIKEAAITNPDKKFQIMDWTDDQPVENLWAQIYAVDQAAFLAGYAAASATKTGKVGTFGGINIPPVADFMDGFAHGVAYYNEKNNAQVEVLGWDIAKQDGLFIGDFLNTNEGRRITAAILDQGADIILPVAGPSGLGAAQAVKERGNAYIIGVDTDWTVTFPEYTDILLTSIEKRMDVSAASAIHAIVDGTFTGGTHTGTLENGGVRIAPFHALDALVSPAVKMDLEQIRADIITGKIKTRYSDETTR